MPRRGTPSVGQRAGFRHPYKCDDQAIPLILQHFAQGSTVGSLLDSTDNALASLPTVYHLLWRGPLDADLDHPLDPESLIWSRR